MKRKILTVIGLLVILAGVVIIFIFSRPIRLSAACQKAQDIWGTTIKRNQVIYADGCFLPNPLKIKAGESVIFTDKDEKEMWIESDKKGDDLILRNFTSGQSWSVGQSYSYKFSKTGSYGYHNKKKPQDVGRIIVQ